MKVALLTAITDNYDTLKPVRPQAVQTETICVTDNPELRAAGWDTIVYESHPDMHPNRAAKRPKCCPWRYTDADVTIWLDGSFEIVSPDFVEAMLGFLPLGQFEHWDRDCLYDEARYSMGMNKYKGEPLEEQIASYDTPEHWGLWATGVIVRERTPAIEKFGERWLDEIDRWSFQDQVSEPAVLHEFGLRPNKLPGTYRHNPWILYAGSGRH